MDILKQQYELIRSSRMVVLKFIEENLLDDIDQPIIAFSGKSVSYLLMHIADVYKFWLGEFCMNKPQNYTSDTDDASVDLSHIRQAFEDVDNLVADFIRHYTKSSNAVVTGTVRSGKLVNSTPLELFTHVMTHEFHHKGQIMSMCRLMGEVPPDTDIIRT